MITWGDALGLNGRYLLRPLFDGRFPPRVSARLRDLSSATRGEMAPERAV